MTDRQIEGAQCDTSHLKSQHLEGRGEIIKSSRPASDAEFDVSLDGIRSCLTKINKIFINKKLIKSFKKEREKNKR